MEQHGAWFFLGLIVFIFLVWIATGGPLRPIAFKGPSLAQLEELDRGTYIQLPRAPFIIGNTRTSLPRSSSGAIPPALYGISFGVPSPLRDFISMNPRVSNASSSDPRNEYVQLFTTLNARTSVTVSGWRLMSETTYKFGILPQGARVPIVGVVNPLRDIELAPGERVVVVSGRSPIGISFRENKCTGYLNTYQPFSFSPPLPRSCPTPLDEFESFAGSEYPRDADCITYIKKIPRCETVLFPPRKLSPTCKNFVLEYLNYNSCVTLHENDTDFHGTTWRIYLDLSKHLWRARYEVVKLIDTTGKTVAAFSY